MRIDEFLLARIAEDEAVAREAFALRKDWEAFRMVTADPDPDLGVWADSEHVAMGVERMLAECEAKRAIIADIFQYEQKIDGEWGDCHTAEQIQAGECPEYGPAGTGAINGLRILASVYADHPDYRPEWAA